MSNQDFGSGKLKKLITTFFLEILLFIGHLKFYRQFDHENIQNIFLNINQIQADAWLLVISYDQMHVNTI